MTKGKHIPLEGFQSLPPETMEQRADDFYAKIRTRRSIRDFSDKAVPDKVTVIFSKTHGVDDGGDKVKHYYVSESVGIATGFLIAALHDSECATLTHTPTPMKFLNQILDRPSSERAFLVLVVGQPAEGALVPDITKKPLSEIATWH